MLKIESWFKEEAKGTAVLFYMVIFLILDLFLNCLISMLFDVFNVVVPHSEPNSSILTFYFPIILLGMAFIEEIFFRFPLVLLVALKLRLWIILAVSVILSIIFGLLHGGIPNIFLQGIGGLFYSILFLKCGGYHGKLIKPLAAAAFTHFFFNGVLVLMCLAQGIYKI